MTKIVTGKGRTVTVRVRTVGQCFGTVATARIGGRAFESSVVPYGFVTAAVESIAAKIEAWEASR